jgi:hypothetical protein
MDRATHEDIDQSRPSLWLWLAILGPAAMWFLDQQLSFALVQRSCTTGHRSLMGALTVGCLLVVAALAAMARRYRHDVPPDETEASRRRFMVGLALMSTVFFALVIVATAVPKVLLWACD